MSIIQVSKIQMRRGLASDLPNPTLDDGEFGFTTDLGRLFIGQNNPTSGEPNYDRNAFPYQNIEVLTENSPLDSLLIPVISNNTNGFIKSVPLNMTGTANTFQVYDSTNAPQNFNVNLVGGTGANAIISYFIYDPSNNPIRVGRLNVIWNTTMIGTPICSDDADVSVGSLSDIQWSAALTGSIDTQYVVLQYINLRSDTPTVYFKIDRPFVQ